MSKHSPGPWHPHVNAADDLEINTPDGRTVVKWYQSQDCLSPGDPALIAAAPEMLESLREFLGVWDGWVRQIETWNRDAILGPVIKPNEDPFVVKIRALLARIDGEG